jgi:signal transduction histidine kinase
VSSVANVIEFPARRRRIEPPPDPGAEAGALAERRRIRRELHDVVSHSLATISVQAGVALHVMDERPEQATAALEAIKSTSREALRELRKVLGVLGDVTDAESGAGAPRLARVDALVANVSAAGTPTELRVVGRPRLLPSSVDHAGFRIVQESLSNVLRHAGPASAVVTIAYQRDCLVVEVEDNGGAPASGGPTLPGAGSGIAGMRERARAIGGDLEAAPREERGFRVRARLPVLGRP